jgi:hypothetical protein
MDAEQPGAAPAPETPAPSTPEPELSVTDHAQAYSPTRADETPAEAEERRHHSAEQRREKETGKFAEGKMRHRAQSQKATPEDAPRIQQLTGRAKAAEERAQAAESELLRLRSQQAPPAQIARAEAKVEQTQAASQQASGFRDPEPQEDDPAFANDYAKYLRAVAKWEGRKAQFEWREQEAHVRQQARQIDAQQRELSAWGGRMTAAAQKYPDFHERAMLAPVPWLDPQGNPLPHGVAIDAFIREDDNGGDVLYYLQTHPDERDALVRMPLFRQVKQLALLAQRFEASPQSSQAGTTGSVAGPRLVVAPPKPPNPVRTEAQRTGTAGPPTDGTLSVMSHAKAFKRPY